MQQSQTAQLPAIREAAWSALVVADGKPDALWTASEGKPADQEALIASLGAVADPALRSPFQPALLGLINNPQTSGSLRKAAFVGRRLRHHRAEYVTRVNFTPQRDGDFAGLLAQMDETHFVALGIEDGAIVL